MVSLGIYFTGKSYKEENIDFSLCYGVYIKVTNSIINILICRSCKQNCGTALTYVAWNGVSNDSSNFKQILMHLHRYS